MIDTTQNDPPEFQKVRKPLASPKHRPCKSNSNTRNVSHRPPPSWKKLVNECFRQPKIV